jgi:hypothetical protein
MVAVSSTSSTNSELSYIRKLKNELSVCRRFGSFNGLHGVISLKAELF